MRGSSSDDADDAKVKKRRQQKRDYATRKRQQDKQLLHHLEMRNKTLSRDSRRQKHVIQQLKAWATYAQSYLSLCCQLLTFRSPPSTPQGQQQSPGKSDHLPPEKAPALQKDTTSVTEGLEEYEGPASPDQSACLQHPSPTSLQDPEGVDAPIVHPQAACTPTGGGKPGTAQTTAEVMDSCLGSSLMSPEADRRSPCPSVELSEADRRSSDEEVTCPDQSPSPEYLLVTDCVTACEFSDPDLLYLLLDGPVGRPPLHHAVSQLCPVSIADYTWGQTLQDFVTDFTSKDDVTEPDSTQECSGWPGLLSLY